MRPAGTRISVNTSAWFPQFNRACKSNKMSFPFAVPRVGSGERYSAEVSALGDRLWRIYVYAESAAGKSIAAVTPVLLKADTTGAAVSDVVLEVA